MHVHGGRACDWSLVSPVASETRTVDQLTEEVGDPTMGFEARCIDSWDFLNGTYHGCDVASDWKCQVQCLFGAAVRVARACA